MYSELATRLAVAGDGTAGVSQAVSMEGANAAQLDFTVYEIDNTTSPTDILTVKLEGSNDLQNWSDLSTSKTAQAMGYFESSLKTSVPYAYVRLNYQLTTSDSGNAAVISAGINTVHN